MYLLVHLGARLLNPWKLWGETGLRNCGGTYWLTLGARLRPNKWADRFKLGVFSPSVDAKLEMKKKKKKMYLLIWDFGGG